MLPQRLACLSLYTIHTLAARLTARSTPHSCNHQNPSKTIACTPGAVALAGGDCRICQGAWVIYQSVLVHREGACEGDKRRAACKRLSSKHAAKPAAAGVEGAGANGAGARPTLDRGRRGGPLITNWMMERPGDRSAWCQMPGSARVGRTVCVSPVHALLQRSRSSSRPAGASPGLSGCNSQSPFKRSRFCGPPRRLPTRFAATDPHSVPPAAQSNF